MFGTEAHLLQFLKDTTKVESSAHRSSFHSVDIHDVTPDNGCTNPLGIVMFVLFVVVLLAMMGYCIINGSLLRIVNGYDNCGNVCGTITKPEKDPKFACKGGDFRDKKYLLIRGPGEAPYDPRNADKECVKDCNVYPGFRKVLGRCILEKEGVVVNLWTITLLEDFFQEVSEDLSLAWMRILCLGFVSMGLSIICIHILRCCTAITVWVLIVLAILMTASLSAFTWKLWFEKWRLGYKATEIDDELSTTYLTIALISTVICSLCITMAIASRKQILLVSKLFAESGKALIQMPLLIFWPIVTVLTIICVIATWFVFALWIESAGFLTYNTPNFYYKKDDTMKSTRWFNIFAMYWMVQFCISCQHMIISGAVVDWYFTWNKDQVAHPIRNSIRHLLSFHLGSTALGSLSLGLAHYLRAAIVRIGDMLNVEARGIYGMEFVEAGKRAFNIVLENQYRIYIIDSIGDFLFAMSKIFVVFGTCIIGIAFLSNLEGLQHIWTILLLSAMYAYFISHCFMSVYEMTIDAIFVCFCEDCELNDGVNHPYFMSRGLMEFVKHSEEILKHRKSSG